MQNLAKTRSHVRSLSCFKLMEFACCINLCIAMLARTLTLMNARSAKRRVRTSLAEQGERFHICPLSLFSVRSCRIAPTPLVSSTGPINMQRPPCLGQRRIFSMGSIITRFLESVLLLETEGYPTISWIIVTSHSASPPTALLHSKCRSIPRRSSSFSTTNSLRTNALKRTTFFVLGSYPVQKIHGMQTPSSIRSCENCLSSRSACIYDALSGSLCDLHAYAIAGFGDIPAISMLMHMKGHNGLCPCRMCGIQGIHIPDSRNKTPYAPLSRRNLLHQLMSSSITRRGYRCARTIAL